MLKYATPIVLELLLDIFNKIWVSSNYSSIWKLAEMIPILKPNKSNYNLENYRPISLISVLVKIIEKIINSRLLWTLESRQLLHQQQCGFRSGRSTVDQLVLLQNSTIESFSQQQHLLAVSLNLTKAFDSFWKQRIVDGLETWRINVCLGKYIKNFLENRQAYIRVLTHTQQSSHFKMAFHRVQYWDLLSLI